MNTFIIRRVVISQYLLIALKNCICDYYGELKNIKIYLTNK